MATNPMQLLSSFAKAVLFFLKTRLFDVRKFSDFLVFYARKKFVHSLIGFEGQKDILVKFLLMKRGRYNRPFLHVATMGVLAAGVIVGPFLADTYPILTPANAISNIPSPAPQEQSIEADNNVFETSISQKPRDRAIDYTVQPGDTLSTVADKFGVSVDTIKWANDISSDMLTVGDTLKILPVTGVSYKVQSGDTIYSIAKKFSTNPQKIADWPFNDFASPETFSLVVGEVLIVPDGIQPSAVLDTGPGGSEGYIARAPAVSVSPSGGWGWPINGIVTQFPSWYHMAYDIAAPIGTPIVATKDGIVKEVWVGGWNYGYGTHVVLDHGDGYTSLYAHMSAVGVSVGQHVVGGQTVVGYVGMTGHTTGPHVHFEIRKNNITLNPSVFVH
ncbi:MAG: M23 family metallopeptidase [Patescibacteria group bacterium]|nr:M23 family metallopeptidase [Patescibacteria group bacterium]MDE2588446.1 M23 family metallopeptidase [Patescibacteria group bacterium]